MNVYRECLNTVRDAAQIIALAWRYSPRLMTVTPVVVLVAALAPYGQNYVLGRLLDRLATDVSGSQALTWVLIGLGFIIALSSLLQFFLKTVVYKRFFRFFAVRIHEVVSTRTLEAHEEPQSNGKITKVLENSMWRAPDFLQRFLYVGQNAMECAIALVIVASGAWWLAAVVLLGAIPRFVIDILHNHNLWKVETELSESRRKFWYVRWYLIDPRALAELKTYQAGRYFVSMLDSILGLAERVEIKAELRNLALQIGALTMSEVSAAAVIVTLVMQVADGTLAIGMFAFYLTSLASFRVALNSLSQNIGSQFKDGKFVRDMFEVESMPSELWVTGRPTPDVIEEIVFEHVGFRYPGSEREILTDITLTLRAGETVGLVARNGSGKTTLGKLLCRFYEPTRGRILVNGIDYREFDLNSWRDKIGIMPQEHNRYDHLDVATSVRIGRVNGHGPGSEPIDGVLAASHADQFVYSLPRGIDTIMSRFFEGGIELSGGQYQTLAISRALYRAPQVLLLDEPTSAIDGEAEAKIFDSMRSVLPHSIKILISHRFYTLLNADKICVLDAGKVAEYGSHSELMALGGIYAARFRAQAEAYER